METERVTVKEIARLAGVSIGTVDRVLHARGGVSTNTKDKIDSIISSLGYEPNILARQLSLNRTWTFRILLPRGDQDSGYWSLCLEGIHRAAHDLAPYNVRLRVDEFDRYDRPAYRALLSDLAEDPCDGLLVAPVLPEDLLPVLASIGEGRPGEGRPGGEVRPGGPVPYVFIDRDAPGASPVAAIGQDAYRGGFLAGRMMSLLAAGGGPLAAVSAHAGDRHIAQRIEGFKAYSQARAIEVVECVELESAEDCDRYLLGFFAARADMAGVFVANSSGHLVGDWLASRGAKRGCSVLSWDLVPANARALREGKIDCVVSQRPAEQAREGLERLFRAAVRGERDGSPAFIPLEVYFKENIPMDGGPIRTKEER